MIENITSVKFLNPGTYFIVNKELYSVMRHTALVTHGARLDPETLHFADPTGTNFTSFPFTKLVYIKNTSQETANYYRENFMTNSITPEARPELVSASQIPVGTWFFHNNHIYFVFAQNKQEVITSQFSKTGLGKDIYFSVWGDTLVRPLPRLSFSKLIKLVNSPDFLGQITGNPVNSEPPELKRVNSQIPDDPRNWNLKTAEVMISFLIYQASQIFETLDEWGSIEGGACVRRELADRAIWELRKRWVDLEGKPGPGE